MPQLFRARVARSGAAVAIAAAVLTVSALALPIRELAAGVTLDRGCRERELEHARQLEHGVGAQPRSDDVTFPAPTGSPVLIDDIGWYGGPRPSLAFRDVRRLVDAHVRPKPVRLHQLSDRAVDGGHHAHRGPHRHT